MNSLFLLTYRTDKDNEKNDMKNDISEIFLKMTMRSIKFKMRRNKGAING